MEQKKFPMYKLWSVVMQEYVRNDDGTEYTTTDLEDARRKKDFLEDRGHRISIDIYLEDSGDEI